MVNNQVEVFISGAIPIYEDEVIAEIKVSDTRIIRIIKIAPFEFRVEKYSKPVILEDKYKFFDRSLLDALE